MELKEDIWSPKQRSHTKVNGIICSLKNHRDLQCFEGHPLEWNIPLKHFKQRYSWDCGLACLRMVLSDKQQEHFHENFNEVCRAAGFNKSTWTIDLSFLLARYHIPHTFRTMTLGVRDDYKGNPFYEKVFNKDELRVNYLFKKASLLGLDVKKGRVLIEDILKHLLIGPAIVLTNCRLLYCETCKYNKLSTDFKKCLPLTTPYEGHYVVACGYNIQKQVVYYRNPVFYDHVCSMRFNSFDDARKSFGTDEDIIFVHMKKSKSKQIMA